MPSSVPCSTPFQFFVPMLRAHAGYLEWIVSNGVGVEIQDLLYPALPSPAPFSDVEGFWRKTLARESLPVSLHGPKVPAGLLDEAREQEDRQQIERAMDVAKSIGASYFIVHPHLGCHTEAGQIERAARAWGPLIEAASDRSLTMLLENTNEDRPECLAQLCALAQSPAMGLCLDVGHAHRHSTVKCEEWLTAFGPLLHYVHLYNSSGGLEQHRALGDGEIDIEAFLVRLGAERPGVTICLEMDVPQILASVPWLTARGLFKLRPIPTDYF